MPLPANATEAASLLDRLGVDDFDRAYRNLSGLKSVLSADEFQPLLANLERLLPQQADPDMALNSLERFLATAGGRAHLPSLFARDDRGLEALLQVFSASQAFGDALVNQPEDAAELLEPLRPIPLVSELVESLQTEIDNAVDDTSVLRTLRRFRRRQHLRIAVNDLVRNRKFEEISQDLSGVAEASIECALRQAWRTMTQRYGEPMTDGKVSRCAVFGFGKLGGEELNYSSDIDLMVIYDDEGETHGRRRPIGNDEFYARLVAELIRLLSAHTDLGQAYRVDFRLRPEGQKGPPAKSLAATRSYYDQQGRTWERQALIKLRPVGGDRELGRQFMEQIEPFIYRMYLSFSEINDIKAMKRHIEDNTRRKGDDDRDVKTGRGGIRDVEFAIQFLQLLNGGELPAVRQRRTIFALQALEIEGCLTRDEYNALDEAYRFLRKTEHRLQILFDWQTHRLPESPEELRKLALRMGYTQRTAPPALLKPPSSTTNPTIATGTGNETGESPTLPPQRFSPLDEQVESSSTSTRDLLFDPLDLFLFDYHAHTRVNRTILDHLLHTTFVDESERAEPESDLILMAHPDDATLQKTLGRHGFRDVSTAYRNLQQLAQEAKFLSSRRCRHFLASIAPALLQALSHTSDPDTALTNLERVTASLGAKAVLWELFSFMPQTLRLYVDICSNSSLLSQILIGNPGMIDELLDSLILNRPREADELRAELKELCRGVEDTDAIEAILHSFQDKEILRIAVRDLLGLDEAPAIAANLGDLAETILQDIVQREEAALQRKYGVPILDGCTKTCRYSVLGLGKLGGREMSYHSDLDIIIIYEGEGRACRDEMYSKNRSTDTQAYFTDLAQRIIKATSQPGRMGRLYSIDMRLRPTGPSGSLVISLDEFQRYHAGSASQIWERQALTRARPLAGSAEFATEVMKAIHRTITTVPAKKVVAAAIRQMRERLESGTKDNNLKRAAGGIADVEFAIQYLQLIHGRKNPSILQTNAWNALDSLSQHKLIDELKYQSLRSGYTFLRSCELRLRMITDRTSTDVPDDVALLQKLAKGLGLGSVEHLQAELQRHRTAIRDAYNIIVRV